MNERSTHLAVVIAIVITLAGACRAAGSDVRRVLAASDGEAYWTAVVFTDASQHGGHPITSVRLRDAGNTEAWREIGLFEANGIQLIGAGSQAILLDDLGTWRWVGGSTSQTGPTLPDGARPTAMTFSTGTVFALARIGQGVAASTQATTPAARMRLYAFRAGAWQRVADIPANAAATGFALNTVGNVPYVAVQSPSELTVWKANAAGVEQVAHFKENSVDLAMLNAGGRPVVWVRRADGVQALFLPLNLSTIPVQFSADQLPAPPAPVAAAVVDETLRLVFPGDGDLQELAFKLDGVPIGGKARTLLPVAFVTPAGRTWIDTMIMALMTVAIVATLRQRPMLSEADYTKRRAELAPLLRRGLAGLIDATPVVAAVVYAWATLPSEASFVAFRMNMSPILWSGVAVYIAHTMVAELLTGRSAGKWVCRLRVERLDGSPPQAWDIVLRNLMRVVDVLGVALIFVVFSPFRQRIGDAAARTVVVVDKTRLKIRPNATDDAA